MSRAQFLLSLAAVVAIGAGAFFSVRFLVDQLSTEAQEGVDVSPPIATALATLIAPRGTLEPRFEDELLGFYIGPRVTDVPERFVTFDDVCPTLISVEVPWERAGALDLELNLPARYVLRDDSVNTGVIACEDETTVYVARRNYRLEGLPSANIIIGRSILTADLFDVAASRVSVATYAGRQAVLIEPGVRDGVQSGRSGVIFPEPFGRTFIHAVSLSLDELMELAELVAEATQR